MQFVTLDLQDSLRQNIDVKDSWIIEGINTGGFVIIEGINVMD